MRWCEGEGEPEFTPGGPAPDRGRAKRRRQHAYPLRRALCALSLSLSTPPPPAPDPALHLCPEGRRVAVGGHAAQRHQRVLQPLEQLRGVGGLHAQPDRRGQVRRAGTHGNHNGALAQRYAADIAAAQLAAPL